VGRCNTTITNEDTVTLTVNLNDPNLVPFPASISDISLVGQDSEGQVEDEAGGGVEDEADSDGVEYCDGQAAPAYPDSCYDRNDLPEDSGFDDDDDSGGSNPEREEEDQSCGGEACTDDEKEDSWIEDEE
jgi:hypothetical protein